MTTLLVFCGGLIAGGLIVGFLAVCWARSVVWGWAYEQGRRDEHREASEWAAGSMERTRIAGLERDRLRVLLRRYDRCECGAYRFEHGTEGTAHAFGRCGAFVLDEPADPLETVVTSEVEGPSGNLYCGNCAAERNLSS